MSRGMGMKKEMINVNIDTIVENVADDGALLLQRLDT